MAFFKETRELLLIEHSEKVISDEELLLLLEENTSRNSEFSHEIYERFNLEEIEEPECKANFRFEKNDIPVLAEALGLPEVFRCSQRTVADQLEGLCLLLRRMAYPCRYPDLIPQFGRSAPDLSMISNCVIDEIFNHHSHRIAQWNHGILDPNKLESYADAIHSKGAALDNCFAFVDGTVRPISRPIENQEILYNDHKRIHALKFQSVRLPNGLMANMCGPVEGKRHDGWKLGESHLLDDLERVAFSTGRQPMHMYGDPAHPVLAHLQSPYRGNRLLPAMVAFNESMRKVRTSVEWVFGDVVSSFKFMDLRII